MYQKFAKDSVKESGGTFIKQTETPFNTLQHIYLFIRSLPFVNIQDVKQNVPM